MDTYGNHQRYPAYKGSGFEWLGEIPAHWKIDKIKSLCQINDGNHGEEYPTEQDFTDDVNGVPFIRGSNLDNFSVSYEGLLYITREKDSSMRKGNLQENDILFMNRGEIGKLAIIDKRFVGANLNSQIAYLRPHTEKVHPFFLLYFLSSQNIQSFILSMKHGSTLTQFPLKRIAEIIVLLPSIAQQKAIVRFLDHKTSEIDTLIAAKKRLISLLQEKRAALITQAVTKGLDPSVPMKDSGVEWLGEIPAHWEIEKIKSLCHINDGNHGEEYPTQQDFIDGTNGVPFIRGSNLDALSVSYEGMRYITKEKDSSMRKGNLQENDILFMNRGEIGKLAIVDKRFIGANLNSQIAYLRANAGKIRPYFLLYYLASQSIKSFIRSMKHGSTLTQFPLKRIAEIEVLVPPNDEQERIITYLNDELDLLESLLDRVNSGISVLAEYRTALISAAVTGKIDVRDYT